MKDLGNYIQESIFDKDAASKVARAAEELWLENLKKYTYDNLDSTQKFDSPWESGTVKIGKNGIEIECRQTFGRMRIQDLDPGTKLHISKFKGKLDIIGCDIKNLENIFEPNCVFDGDLCIGYNDNLQSLKGIENLKFNNPSRLILKIIANDKLTSLNDLDLSRYNTFIFYVFENNSLKDVDVKKLPKLARNWQWSNNGVSIKKLVPNYMYSETNFGNSHNYPFKHN